MKILPTDVDQIFNYSDKVNLKKFSYGSCFMVSPPVAPHPGRPLPIFLHSPEDFLAPEQIEGHLPEEGINGILDDSGKPGPESIVVRVA